MRLRTPVSPNVSNQLSDRTCYAHVGARILLRYFKKYIIQSSSLRERASSIHLATLLNDVRLVMSYTTIATAASFM